MAGAIIIMDQPSGAGSGLPGVARNDLWQLKQINLSCATVNSSYQWDLLDAPPGAAASLTGSSTSTPTFTPDLIGTYRIQLVTNGGGPGNVQILVARVRYNSSGVLQNRGWSPPAFGEQSGESNYGGNLRGWAEEIEFILGDIRTSLGSSGFTAGADLSGTSTSQTVVGLRGHAIKNQTPTDGQLLTWVGADSMWEPADPPSGFAAGGDLNGTSTNQRVIGLQGRFITGASPSDGQILQWSQTNNEWIYIPLPTSLPPTGAAGGDLTGSYPNPTVAKMRGTPINSTGPTSGQVPQYDGSQITWTTPHIEYSPWDLNLHEYFRAQFVNFMPPALVIMNELFTDPTLTRFSLTSEGTPVTPTIASGQMTFANTAGQNTIVREGNDIDMCQFAVAIKVVSLNQVSGNSYENVDVGFAKDNNNFIWATWRPMESTASVSIQVKIGGSSVYAITVFAALTPPFDLGLSLVANSLVVWTRPNGGSWKVLCAYDVTSLFNFKTQSLTGWKAAFGFASDSTHPCTLVVSNFQSGRFGSVGIRDTNPVTALDGTPAISGSTLTFTSTNSDPTGAAYCAVMTADLVAMTVAQVGVLTVAMGTSLPGAGSTTSGSGSQNHNAAHIINDGSGGYHFWITSWGFTGASNIQLLYKHVTGGTNLLSGANAVSSMVQPNVQGIPSGGGMYDPCLVQTGGVWYMATTANPSGGSFYPVLQSSTDLVTWTLIGSDSTLPFYEGSRIVKIGGAYWATWGGQSDGLVYDMTFAYRGRIKTAFSNSGTSFPPHIPLITYPGSPWVYQVTFTPDLYSSAAGTNQAGTQGKLVLIRASRYGLTL